MKKSIIIFALFCATDKATSIDTATQSAASAPATPQRVAIVGTEWSPIAKNIDCAANIPIMCATAYACCDSARRDLSSSIEAFDEQANIIINKIQGLALDLEKEKNEAQSIREQQSQRINELKEQLADCISK